MYQTTNVQGVRNFTLFRRAKKSIKIFGKNNFYIGNRNRKDNISFILVEICIFFLICFYIWSTSVPLCTLHVFQRFVAVMIFFHQSVINGIGNVLNLIKLISKPVACHQLSAIIVTEIKPVLVCYTEPNIEVIASLLNLCTCAVFYIEKNSSEEKTGNWFSFYFIIMVHIEKNLFL